MRDPALSMSMKIVYETLNCSNDIGELSEGGENWGGVMEIPGTMEMHY